MSTNLRSALRRWVPPWMAPRPAVGDAPAKDHGFKFLYAHGLFVDLSLEALTQGIQARLPGVGTPSALGLIGRDRRIRRGFDEPDDAYARRLIAWREDWKRAGNPYVLMKQVRGYLYPHTPLMRVWNNAGTCYTLNPDDTHERDLATWNWDGNTDLWARIWLVIYASGTPWVRDGTWNDGEFWNGRPTETWGSTATPEQVSAIRSIVADWKAAHEVCQNIIISFDDEAFGPASSDLPDGTWGKAYKIDAGVAVPSRDDRGIYWRGVA